jgi:hypothetical protein
MNRAVSQLDAILHQKTVHSTASICESMRALCGMHHLFDSRDAQQYFAQLCRNFEIYSERMEKRSWGRNEFEAWWNEQVAPEPGVFRSEHTGKPYQEDPPYFEEPDTLPKSNVVDMFTRSDYMKMGQDYAANDAAASAGTYIGVLPKHASVPMRETAEDLARRRAQIDALMAEFTPRWEGYFFMTVGALTTLGVDTSSYDPEKQELFVDEDGHCWMVNKE